jgi:hypothetical protein
MVVTLILFDPAPIPGRSVGNELQMYRIFAWPELFMPESAPEISEPGAIRSENNPGTGITRVVGCEVFMYADPRLPLYMPG